MSMTIREIASKLPGTHRQFKDKTPVIYQGEVPRTGFFLKRGNVKAYNLHSSGNEQIIGYYGPGDFFPLPWLYGKIGSELYYYEAVTDCEVISVTKQDIQDIIQKDPQLKDYVFDKLLSHKTALQARVLSLAQPRANEKLEYTLYYLLFRHGKHIKDDLYVIDMPLTHIALASLVGLTRETVTTEINRLKKRGILSYKQKMYTVDRLKLEKSMGEDSFGELFK